MYLTWAGRMTVSNYLERIWKETAVAYCDKLSWRN